MVTATDDYGPFTQGDVSAWSERMERLHPARVMLAATAIALYPYALAAAILAAVWRRKR